MKKKWFFSVLTFFLLLCSCEQDTEDWMNEHDLSAQVEASLQKNAVATRSDVQIRKELFVSIGDLVGVFAKYGNTLTGPEYYTVENISGIGRDILTFEEPVRFKDPSLPHTFYGYYPLEASRSTDPTRVDVLPVSSYQRQTGKTDTHVKDLEYYVADPVVVNPGNDLKLNFYSVYSAFEFRINTNIEGLKVHRIEYAAPDDKMVTFASGKVDITKSLNRDGFAEIKDITGGSSAIRLDITGENNIPNSTTDFFPAFISFRPFDGTSEMMKITVYTNQGEYVFERNSFLYESGNLYTLNLRIEKKKTAIKNIKVLSLCEVGYLGKYDNTQQWGCNYGVDAFTHYTKNMRRILFEQFGKGKTVETGVISFEKTDTYCHLNKMTDCQLDKYDIIFLNNNARPDEAMARRIMNWLNRSPNRVLMLAFDWKEPCLYSTTKNDLVPHKLATNYLIFKNHITGVKPHWYNGANKPAEGNYGAARSCLFIPFELNARSSYFWKDGPFKTCLTESSKQYFWIKDVYWGCAEVTDPNVIPLVTYRNPRKDSNPDKSHCNSIGDNGMVLGVDPVKRIVYIGDSELFSMECTNTDAKKAARITFDKKGQMNDYGKIMANLWAWMVNEVVQKQ